MKNKEKYFDKIIEVVFKDYPCDFIEKYCFDCCGSAKEDCVICEKKFKSWLEQEYVEKPRLSNNEYIILKNLNEDGKWIARSVKNDLYVYVDKPTKNTREWYESYGYLIFAGYNHLFQFVKYEDDEPYSIQELIDEYEKIADTVETTKHTQSELTYSMELESARFNPSAVPAHKWQEYFVKVFDKLREYEYVCF